MPSHRQNSATFLRRSPSRSNGEGQSVSSERLGSAKGTAMERRKEREPVKEDHLRILHEGLDLSGKCGKDHAIAAAAKALFAGQMRAGELLGSSPSISDFNNNNLPTVGDLLPPNNTGERILRLPKTKMAQSRGEKVILASQAGHTCPNCAFHHHLQVNRLEDKHPLMAYRDEHNSLAILTKSDFLTVTFGLRKDYPE
ncbi:hypothetical protein BT96DRAFT_944265 [Gymnopus androsaceus JB14]|uniref:Uncharacterized protein n=1 Tax=Gymnopus androsaceus JB14 TaxID=1447944 RepID=A0A6A4H4A7_9AGAR|nr:hypothetical protein BT96DRAFT_944265 [Gymnopus androsaceus JB14]